jgi:putative ABC transport system permease protein
MKKKKLYFKMIVSSFLRRKSRMMVALLAVAIGATLLTGLGSIYLDISRQMGQEFRSYGANMIFLPSGDEAGIDETSYEKLLDVLPESAVIGVTPYKYRNIKINEQPFMAVGTDFTQTAKTSPYWYITGDSPENAGEALIGKEVASTLRVPVGGEIEVVGTDASGNDFAQNFSVSGILETGGSEEAYVFVSLGDFDGMAKSGDFDVIECSLSLDKAELENIAKQVSNNIPALTARLVQKLTQSEGNVMSKLKGLMLLVTIVVLVLTMICVATTMMAMVTERRKEIGLRKALGAEDGSIMADFLGEGVLVGLAGGIVGVILGVVFAWAVGTSVFDRPIEFRPSLLPVTLVAAVLVTVAAAIIPVRRTTQIDPAVVLKGE